MNYLSFFYLLIFDFVLMAYNYLYADILNVSDDYYTIQEAIDASQDIDTVLVAQGIYYENLIIEKNITLTSNAMYDDLTEWVEYSYIFGEYQLLNDNIENTLINGSNDTNGEDTIWRLDISNYENKNKLIAIEND